MPFNSLLCAVTRTSLIALLGISQPLFAETDDNPVEVFHYWTTESEARSIAVLRELAERSGLRWDNQEVEGGAGEAAFATLQARLLSSQAPDIGQIKGLDIQRWARLGMLTPLDDINTDTGWQSALPTAYLNHLKLDGRLYAVPIHIHRTNWIWINQTLLDAAGLATPTDWNSLISTAEALDAAGMNVIAQSFDGWQLATLFESLVLANAGPDVYQQVFVDLSYSAARSRGVEIAFERLRALQGFFTPETRGSGWDENAVTVADGGAAIMFMGDWVKGEMEARNKTAGVDYSCVAMPGPYQGFIYDTNSFAQFRHGTNSHEAGQTLLRQVLSSEFQTRFNALKGSMPIHRNVNVSQFDTCTRQAIDDFDTAATNRSLVPSIAHGLANVNGVQHELFDVLTDFIGNPQMTSADATRLLAKRLRYGAYAMTGR